MKSVDLINPPVDFKEAVIALEEKYIFERDITKGANGYVLVGVNRVTEQKVIVKFYYWASGTYAEPKTLAGLDHENVLQVLDAAPVNDQYAYFVTPYCEVGDLDDLLKLRRLGPTEAVHIVSRICSGVSYFHGEKLIHRDLKLSNILLRADGRPVIGDFGSVRHQNDSGYATSPTKHSLIYRPPEDFSANDFFVQGDVYQLGLVLFQLLGGRFPYEERQWLSVTQAAKYDQLCGFDAQMFAADVIQQKIISPS